MSSAWIVVKIAIASWRGCAPRIRPEVLILLHAHANTSLRAFTSRILGTVALSRYHCRKGNQQTERTWDAHDSTRSQIHPVTANRTPGSTSRRNGETRRERRARSLYRAILGGFSLTERASRRRAGCSRRNTVVERLTCTPPRTLTDR